VVRNKRFHGSGAGLTGGDLDKPVDIPVIKSQAEGYPWVEAALLQSWSSENPCKKEGTNDDEE
jgi:hypothetical protein